MTARTDRTGRLPNFVIIGAAKSGTTSLFEYLAQHPDVFCCEPKEPGFFAYGGRRPTFDGPVATPRSVVVEEAAYRALFTGANGRSAVGEASTVYLPSASAAERIARAIPQVRLIAILRDPVARAYSAFMHMRRYEHEPEADFRAAVASELSGARARWSPMLRYVEVGMYGRHLARYFELFDAARIQVHLYEELVARPAAVVGDVLRFLEVDDTFVPDVSARYNLGGVPRSATMHRLLNTPPAWVRVRARQVLPASVRRGLYLTLHRRNLTPLPPLPPDSRAWLLPHFMDDLTNLHRLLGRDLSAWMTP